jgi:hypothetical protein
VLVRDGCAFPKLFILQSELCRALLLVWSTVSVFADVEEVGKDDAAGRFGFVKVLELSG